MTDSSSSRPSFSPIFPIRRCISRRRYPNAGPRGSFTTKNRSSLRSRPSATSPRGRPDRRLPDPRSGQIRQGLLAAPVVCLACGSPVDRALLLLVWPRRASGDLASPVVGICSWYGRPDAEARAIDAGYIASAATDWWMIGATQPGSTVVVWRVWSGLRVSRSTGSWGSALVVGRVVPGNCWPGSLSARWVLLGCAGPLRVGQQRAGPARSRSRARSQEWRHGQELGSRRVGRPWGWTSRPATRR